MNNAVRRFVAALIAAAMLFGFVQPLTSAVKAEDAELVQSIEVLEELPDDGEQADEGQAEPTAEIPELIGVEAAEPEHLPEAEQTLAPGEASASDADEESAQEPETESDPEEEPSEEPSVEATDEPGDAPVDENDSDRTINPNLPVSKNPSFGSGYVMAIRSTNMYTKKTGGVYQYTLQKAQYAYAVRRVNIGTEKERVFAAVNIGNEVIEAYISVNDMRPLSTEEVEKYMRAVKRDSKAAKYGAAMLITSSADKLDQAENTGDGDREAETLKPFRFISFTASAAFGRIDSPITFTSSSSGGVEPLTYIFRVFRNGKQITSNTTQSARRFSYTPAESGTYYARVTVKDSAGRSIALNSTECVVAPALKVDRVSTGVTTLSVGQSTTYSIKASGGTEPYKYRFVIKRDGKQVEDTGYIDNRLKRFIFTKPGKHTVVGYVKDSTGTVSSRTSEVLEVTNDLEIDAFRLFDGKGNEIVINDNGESIIVAPGSYVLETRLKSGVEPCYLNYAVEIQQQDASYSWKTVKEYETDRMIVSNRVHRYSLKLDKSSKLCLTAHATDSTGTAVNRELKPILASAPLKFVSFEPNTRDAEIDSPITFTVSTSGGIGPFKYTFRIFRNGEQITSNTIQSNRRFAYTPKQSGTYYARVSIEDSLGNKAARNSGECAVASKLIISRVSTGVSKLVAGQRTTYSIGVSGGKAPLQYRFVTMRGDERIADTGYTSNRLQGITFAKAGTYTVEGFVKDARGKIVSLTSASLLVLEPFVIESISTGSSSPKLKDSVVFRAAAKGGEGGYKYRFRLYRSNSCIFDSGFADNSTCGYTYDTYGDEYYLRVDASDASGAAVNKCSSVFTVSKDADYDNSGDYSYRDIDGTYCAITGYSASGTALVLPNKSPQGLIVSDIDFEAFSGKTNIRTIIIPNGVKGIGNRAFYNCKGLMSVELPSGLLSIGDSAFENCEALHSITIPASTAYIGDKAFAYSALTSVTLMNGIQAIDQNAFRFCSALTSISIPQSVTSIETGAFSDCASLSKIIIPYTVTAIGEGAFSGSANIVIYGLTGTYAQKYANKYSIPFVSTGQYMPNGDVTCRAVIVGQRYAGQSNELTGTVNDARAIEAMLDNFTASDYSTARYTDLTGADILTKISEGFSDADANDISFFFYSGHGAYSLDASMLGALCGTSGYVTPAQLRNALDKIPGKKVVVIDACHSGNMIGPENNKQMTAREIKANADSFANAFVSAFSANAKSSDNLAGSGYYVICAARYDELSWEATFNGTRAGYFTLNFTKCAGWDMQSGSRCELLGDSNGNGALSIDEAYRYVRNVIPKEKQSVQAYPIGSTFEFGKR